MLSFPCFNCGASIDWVLENPSDRGCIVCIEAILSCEDEEDFYDQA
jgi:hypothetical protein